MAGADQYEATGIVSEGPTGCAYQEHLGWNRSLCMSVYDRPPDGNATGASSTRREVQARRCHFATRRDCYDVRRSVIAGEDGALEHQTVCTGLRNTNRELPGRVYN